MSLWEMINCSVLLVANLLAGLKQENIHVALHIHKTENNGEQVDTKDIIKINDMLELAEVSANEFEWGAVKNRIARFKKALKKPINYSTLQIQITALTDAVEDGLKDQYIYRYPNSKAQVLSDWLSDWKPVHEVFPESKNDIIASVDLWALGHNTASVFQLMRILELGLKRLSSHLNVKYSIQTWQNIIDQIESEIKKRQKNLPRGDKKNEELQFLAEAAKEFSYFKDGWRNYVSHNKVTYDTHMAHSVMEHVRQFMTTLSHHLPSGQEEFNK